MKTFKEVNQVYSQIFSITCDKCGKTYKTGGDSDECFEAQEFLRISFTGGYGSIFGDMNQIECDLCQYCVKELLGSYLKIKENDIFKM